MPRTHIAALAAIGAAFLIAGCGGSGGQAAAVHHGPAHLSALQACRKLRQDMIANGGKPDPPAIRAVLAGDPGDAGKDDYHLGLAGDLRQYLSDAPDTSAGNIIQLGDDLQNVTDDCMKADVTLPVVSF